MFRSFDFGKSIMKQIEGFRRLTPQQRKQREPKLIKQLEKYATKYMNVVSNPGSANPGLLKNGAEVLVESASVLSDSGVAYSAFAGMVARSRKVPVVPGLSGLVDRLLEIPTTLNDERIALLNWRITTGSMRPERYLRYLHERAQLTGDPADWKDYSWGTSQLVKKGSLRVSDDLTIKALDNLMEHRRDLGDRAGQVQMMMAEAQFYRKNLHTVEQILTGIIEESDEFPEGFEDIIEQLLESRPDSCWELHQIVLAHDLAAMSEGKLGWTAVSEKLVRARKHKSNLIDFLLEHPQTPSDDRLSTHVVELILSQADADIPPLLKRWQRTHFSAGARAPVAALAMIKEAMRIGRISQSIEEISLPEAQDTSVVAEQVATGDQAPAQAEQDTSAEPQAVGKTDADTDVSPLLERLEALATEPRPEAEEDAAGPGHLPPKTAAEVLENLAACDSVANLRTSLSQSIAHEMLETGTAGELVAQLQDIEGKEWIGQEARLWLAEKLIQADAGEQAATQLEQITVRSGQEPSELFSRIRAVYGQNAIPGSVQQHIAVVSLESDDYETAYAAACGLPEDSTERRELLTSIGESIQASSGPSARMLMTLANIQRESLSDPAAGLEAATAASLTALTDDSYQKEYAAWVQELPPAEVHSRRGQLAAHMCAQESRDDLLEVALDELEALANVGVSDMPAEALEWLAEIRPQLENVPVKRRQEVLTRWTRLHLTYVVKVAPKEQLPAAIEEATEQLEPEEAYSLVSSLGGEIPVTAKLMLDYSSLVQSGDWQQAINLAIDHYATDPEQALSIDKVYQGLPEEAILPVSQRLSSAFEQNGDQEQQLGILKRISSRMGNGGSQSTGQPELHSFFNETLDALCGQKFEPAVRYRLTMESDSGDQQIKAKDLQALLAHGDAEAAEQLAELFEELIIAEEIPASLLGIADNLGKHYLASSPETSFSIYARTGLATGTVEWAQERIQEHSLAPGNAANQQLSGQLALAAGDLEEVRKVVWALVKYDEHAPALELASNAATIAPEDLDIQTTLVRIILAGESPDFPAATKHILKISQLAQQQGDHPKELVLPLLDGITQAVERHPDNAAAQQLKLLMLALSGDFEQVEQIVRQIIGQGEEATSELLATFENMAIADTEIPSPLIVAWGRALFSAGKVSEALDRLAGLRDAVGDYPEYISLLEEIREQHGGSGAAMQLGEAYLRVNLWQRSAELYTAALEDDESLAEPILTKLRHHAALDPNPTKYPLHLLALRTVAYSTKPGDWGWALSALKWLAPRWSAEELFERAQWLRANIDKVELEPVQHSELLLHLIRLAGKLGKHQTGIGYLIEAWDIEDRATTELLEELKDLDTSQPPEDSQQVQKLRQIQLYAASAASDAKSVINASSELAETGEEGRQQALDALDKFQQTTDDHTPVLLAKLKLLDLANPADRETFISNLKDATQSGVPPSQAKSLIRKVIDILLESGDRPELTQLLIQLLHQLGDQARAWQLALYYMYGDDEPAPTAVKTLLQIADHEFALSQKVALVEILALRGDCEQAAETLAQLDHRELEEELQGRCADVAESLIGTAGESGARRWLVDYYRDKNQEALAADHIVWAHGCGILLDTNWLDAQSSGDMLYRRAQLFALRSESDAAVEQLRREREAKTSDPQIGIAIRLELADHAESISDLPAALEYAKEALELDLDNPETKQRADELKKAIVKEKIHEASGQEDSAERTLQIARLHRECDELSTAIQVLQSGISQGQRDDAVYLELAECFAATGEHTIARRAYLSVLKQIESGGGDANLTTRALYGLALVSEELHDTEEATRYLEELLLIRHNYQDARERLERLYNQAATPRPVKPEPAPEAAQPKPEPAAAKPQEDATTEILNEIMSLFGTDQADNETDSKE